MSIQLCGGLDPSTRLRGWLESTGAVGLLFAGQGPKCHIGQLSSNQAAVWCDCADITTPTIVRPWQSKRRDPESASRARSTGTPVQRAGRGTSAQGSRCWERRPFPRVGSRAFLWANHAPPRAARTSGCSARPLFGAVLGLARAKLNTVSVYCIVRWAWRYRIYRSLWRHLACPSGPVLAGSRSSSTLWPFAPRSSVSALSFSPFLLCFPRVCHSPCVSVFCSCLISFPLLLSALTVVLSYIPSSEPSVHHSTQLFILL